MYKEVRELDRNTLFVWNQQPDYLHQATDERDDNGSPIANHVATMSEGEWRFHEPRPMNWNPYCTIRTVRIV